MKRHSIAQAVTGYFTLRHQVREVCLAGVAVCDHLDGITPIGLQCNQGRGGNA